MNAIVLRAGAALVAAGSFVGATAYVVAHPKNPEAPLQPPAVNAVARPTPSFIPAPSLLPGRRGRTTSSRPAPTITLQPAVHATALPGVTFTHVS